VLWGDHGWHLGEHHIFGKHTSFEGALKSVLIIRTPAMKNQGRPTGALVQSIDIYPTLAGLCGLTPPADIDGTAFLDLLDNPDLAGPEYVLSYNMSYGPSFRNLGRLHAVTMRTRDYRYVQWQKDLGQGAVIFQELYDHRMDPDEEDNLAPKEPEVVKELSKRLAKHQNNKKQRFSPLFNRSQDRVDPDRRRGLAGPARSLKRGPGCAEVQTDL